LPAAQHVPEFDAVFGTTPAQIEREARRAVRRHQARRRSRAHGHAAGCNVASDRPAARRREGPVARVPALEDEGKQREGDLLRLRPAYMQRSSTSASRRAAPCIPDANSTLRVSYGRISPMSPRDGIDYRPLTTVQGIVEKHTGARRSTPEAAAGLRSRRATSARPPSRR
jgi:hypothetical protein